MSALVEIIHDIGRTLLGAAREQSSAWDYVGYTFRTNDGVNFEASGFLFHAEKLQEFTIRKVGKHLGALHLRQREIMRNESDNAWIAARSILRQSDLAFKQHFEFDDPNRWQTSPATIGRQFEVLIGDFES